MRLPKRICTILIALAIFFPSNSVFAQDQLRKKPVPERLEPPIRFRVVPDQLRKKPWSGTLRDGTTINDEDLKRILNEHRKWLNTRNRKGKNAALAGAKLQKANLRAANLQEAELVGAELQEADLRNANLQETWLAGAKLQEAELVEANLQKAMLAGAELQKAVLYRANLQKADLRMAKLQEADLRIANLQEADLRMAKLQEAKITDADLKGCLLYGVENLPFNYYEPKAGSTPYIPSIADAPWLKDLTYNNKVHGLVDLREGFKKFGYREQERKITYAINHTQTLQLLGKSKKDQDKKKDSEQEPTKADTSTFNQIKGYMNLFLFEWTCKWSMSPGRPLIILIILIFPFSLYYMFALILTNTKTKDGINIGDGIWKVWIAERANKYRGSDQNELLSCSKGFEIWGYGLYFSLLSAFHVGFRDINVGGWIAKIQPREYRLQASGWVRTVSGIQSLISVYLLALAVLTYFGRPFESY